MVAATWDEAADKQCASEPRRFGNPLIAVPKHVGDCGSQTFGHPLLGVKRPVSVFNDAHQNPHRVDHQVPPPERSLDPYLMHVFYVSAQFEALALPRGIEPLFQP